MGPSASKGAEEIRVGISHTFPVKNVSKRIEYANFATSLRRILTHSLTPPIGKSEKKCRAYVSQLSDFVIPITAEFDTF